jgi:hypothetical protein
MMENPYDWEIKRTVEDLEACRKFRNEAQGELLDLVEKLARIPRWKLRVRRRIYRRMKVLAFDSYIQGVLINDLSRKLEETKKKSDALEYVRDEK